MKKLISILIVIAMIISLVPATSVFATETAPMSGVKIEYPTCTTNTNGQGKNTSTTFKDSTALPDGMKYENSAERVQWLSHTVTQLVWYRGAISIKNPNYGGGYGAYKIHVPAEGTYNVALQYRKVENGGAVGEMYILPIDQKDNIEGAIATAKAEGKGPLLTVDFKDNDANVNAEAWATPYFETTPFAWKAETAGEYIVVWKIADGSKGTMQPANLIFDGCAEGQEKDALVGKITLSDTELVVGDDATITSSLYNGMTGKAAEGTVTYTCDSDVLTVSGNNVKANKAGNATIYAEAAGYPNKVVLAVTVAEGTAVPVEMSGVRIEYPTCTTNTNGQGKNTSTTFTDSTALPNGIKYENSYNRVEWLSGTAEQFVWYRGAIAIKHSKDEGKYGAYKIHVPAEGTYNVTLQYRKVENNGAEGEMYILPIDQKDNIEGAIATAKAEGKGPLLMVDFKDNDANVNAEAWATPYFETTPFAWEAETAGEYIVVWKIADGSKGAMQPANLIFDGCADGEEKDALVGRITLGKNELVAGDSATITPMLYNGYTGKTAEGTITYTSSDVSILSVNGTTVTANKVGNATLYAEVAGYPNKVALDVTVAEGTDVPVEMSGIWIEYPTCATSARQTSTLFSDQTPPAEELKYKNSYNRVEWLSHTVEQLAWYRGAISIKHTKAEEKHGAYKINVPKAGGYEITVQYRTSGGGADGKMFILPISEKDNIEAAIASAGKPLTTVSFKGADVTTATEFDNAEPFVWTAPSAGEYIVVWKMVEGSKGTMQPANLIFDGGDALAVSSIDFRVSSTLKPSVALYLSDGSSPDSSEFTVTYESSDETLLKINNETGKFIGLGAGEVVVTANVEYNGNIYTSEFVKTLTGDETLPYSDAAKTYSFITKSADWQQTIVDEGESVPLNNDVRNITYDYTDGNYAWYGSTENKNQAAYCYAHGEAVSGRMRMERKAGGWTGFRIMVPVCGKYAVHMEYVKNYYGEGPSDVYIIPSSVSPENAGDYLNEDYYVGTINTLDVTLSDLAFGESWIGEVNIPEAGEYAVIFKAKTKCYTSIRTLTLDGVEGMKRVEIISENDGVDVGKSIQASVRAFLLDGTEIPAEDFTVEYKSEQPHIASVSDDGTITGIYEGIANITATVRYGADVSKTSIVVTVTDNSGMKSAEFATFADELYVGGKTKITILANMNSGNKLTVGVENATFEFTSEPEGILSVEDGYLVANAEGTATVSAIVSFRGETKETNELMFNINVGTQKNRTTIYTDEMRAAALENAKNYDWAKTIAKNAKTTADSYLEHIDLIYDMIDPDNIPRSSTAALLDDPNAYSCIYCGIDIRDEYGSYAWGVNPISRPWKIQCPDCKRLFPSNDFESFYELGKDSSDKFDLARARQLHHEMLYHKDGEECICTAPTEENTPEWYEFYGYGIEGGYLYNELYPDVNKNLGVAESEVGRWGVDDGWGYATGEIASSGVPIRKAFVAFYNFSIWSAGSPVQYIGKALKALKEAYLYTGEEKYGIAGAIITDRIADVYPTYSWEPYLEFQHSHGGMYNGKIDGCIWGRNHGIWFAEAYDAFWPIMGHPKVIEYLSKKATEYGLENEKLSAEMIRKNCDDGICREVFKAIKNSQIHANFGAHQQTLATAAIALDSMPETEEMIAWLLAPSVITKETVYKYGKKFNMYVGNSGGEMIATILREVDRDGFGAEVSVTYNQGWFTNVLKSIELFYNYDPNSILNLYNNPKFRKMFYAIYKMTMAGDYSLQVGDHYSTADTTNDTDRAAMLTGYLRLNDPLLARMYYSLVKTHSNPSTFKSMFEARNGTIDEEIEGIVDEYGEIELSSENLAGFGLAVLRDGEKIMGSNAKNLKRDTWLWYGKSDTAHGHRDVLQMGIDAYGFNFTPDLGYPPATGNDPNRVQWVMNTLSHNTVVVDGKRQNAIDIGNPIHFDDAGKVKLVDVEAPEVYTATDIYRRTLVSVQASNEVDYTVDFFRIRGGNEHIYSFHTQSFNGVTTDGLNMEPQNGGTYAGENTDYGNDPYTQNSSSYETAYPIGYTWLRNVQRDNEPVDGTFSVNFKQTDFNKQVSDSKGLNLKWTALNDWAPSSVGIATAEPPKLAQNKNIPELDYMLIHRKSENRLDTLFTSVIQPYNGEEYIESMNSVALTVTDGEETDDDTAKAVKVKLKSGRCDYIVYATNNGVTYTLTDGNVSFNFRGFVGVYSVNENGVNIYSYVNDGDIIGDIDTVASVSGKVVDFEKELSLENYIAVELDNEVNASSLAGRYIYVDNSGKSNGAYRIESAEVDGKNAVLDIGDVTLINEYRDSSNAELGYIYNISENNKFVIPFSTTEDTAPELDDVAENLTTSAGSSISITMNATSPSGESVTYVGTHIPRGATLDGTSGKVTWKPDSSQVGTHTFVITARDASGRENTTSFEITVYGSTTSKPSTENSGASGEGAGSAGGGGGAAPDNGNASDTTVGDGGSDVPNDDVVGSGNTNVGNGVHDVPNFTDIGSHVWATDAINELATAGIIRGTSETTFAPASNITRADFALLLVRAFKLTSDNAENFADVSASDYFASELAIARNNGIISGIGDNKFAPRNTITRQDMMVIVYRALQKLNVGFGIYDEPQNADFANVASYAKSAATALVGAGLVNGKNNLVAPLDYTTRAEVAVLINRILDYAKQ